MSLYEQWTQLLEKERTQIEADEFWTEYLKKEKEVYQELLENHNTVIEGKLSQLGARFNMDPVEFSGFIDGINSSLVEDIKIEELCEDSEIRFNIDFEKLFFNMLGAKADWLYNLDQWDKVLSIEKRIEIRKDFNKSRIAVSNKIGRNQSCPCGSGKKYKKCCGR